MAPCITRSEETWPVPPHPQTRSSGCITPTSTGCGPRGRRSIPGKILPTQPRCSSRSRFSASRFRVCLVFQHWVIGTHEIAPHGPHAEIRLSNRTEKQEDARRRETSNDEAGDASRHRPT